jgi:hypothetical protein
VAIAFGLGGPSHAVGAGPVAALEAREVARDWLAAGDADAMLVIAAEHTGSTARRALAAQGVPALEPGSFAVLLATAVDGVRLRGPRLDDALIAGARDASQLPENSGFRSLEAFCRAAGLPGPGGFGSVRPPE